MTTKQKKPLTKAAPKKKPPVKRRKPTPKIAARATKPLTGEARWWNLIERTRKGTEDGDEHAAQLLEALKQLELDEIVAFDTFVLEKLRDAFRTDLWAVAYIMNGGCSDDGFDYFLGWLLARGKKHYEAALANPEEAARGVSPDDEPFENEMFWYIAAKAYDAKTGSEGSYGVVAPKVMRTLQGELFDEDTVDELHPKLARRFNG